MPILVPDFISKIGYDSIPIFLIEFGFISALFALVFKQSMAVGSASLESMRQHTTRGFGQNLFGSAQFGQNRNAIALLLGLLCTYVLMFYYKITLNTIADNGIAAGFFGMLAGFGLYGVLLSKAGQEGRIVAFIGGILGGLAVYGGLAFRVRLGAMDVLGTGAPVLAAVVLLWMFYNSRTPAAVPPAAPPAAPAAPRQLIPPGPAGAPVAAGNASGAVEAAAAAVQATAVTVNNSAPLAERLDSQHERTERAAADAVAAVERAEEEAEKVVHAGAVSPPEPDLYSQNVMNAAKEGRKLAEEAQKEIQLADVVSNTWGNISEDAFAARETEAVRQVEIAERTLENIESSVRYEPAAATVIPVIEAEKQNLAAARELLTSSAAVAVREAGFLRENIRQESAQIARWKEEVRPIALSIMALVSLIEQKKLPPPKLQEALAELGTLEKRFLQITESHGVDTKNFEVMLPAVRAHLGQSAKTLVQVNSMLEASQKRLTAVPRALLAAPKEEPATPPAAPTISAEPAVNIAELLESLRAFVNLLTIVQSMSSDKSESNLALTKRAASDAGSVCYVLSQEKKKAEAMKGNPIMADMVAVINANLPAVLKMQGELARLYNSFRAKQGKRAEGLAEFNKNNYSALMNALFNSLNEIETRLIRA